MTIYEYGQGHERSVLFIATAALEPYWAFHDPIERLARDYHVYAVAADGYDPESESDFPSIERTVDHILEELHRRGVHRLFGAYGLSMGGAMLNRLLAVGDVPIDRLVIDGGIMPYTYPKPIRRLISWRDFLAFGALTKSRRLLELVAPPEESTPEGHDATAEYDTLMDFYRSYSARTLYNTVWSTNNYALPHPAPAVVTRIEYWYGAGEERARRGDIRYLRSYRPEVRFVRIDGQGHGTLLMVHPREWHERFRAFLEADG